MNKLFILLLSICIGFIQNVYAQLDTNASIKNALKSVEKVAEFNGGQTALIQFLNTNLQYPNKAIENNIQGKVLVEFVVCEDGTICELKASNADTLLQAEAIRVVRKMPQWKPGEQSNKKVSTYFTLPVSFSLVEDDRLSRKDRKAERKARKAN